MPAPARRQTIETRQQYGPHATPSRHRVATGRRTNAGEAPRLREGRDAGQLLPDDELVHLGSAFVGKHALQVVRVPHHRVFTADSVRAKDRAALTRDGERLAHVVQLADADLLRSDATRVDLASEVQRE